MNYHFMIDHWFNNGFIDNALKVSTIDRNIFLLTFPESSSKYIKKHGVYAPFGSVILESFVSQIKEDDKVFIHWFQNPIIDVLEVIPKKTKVYLFFWGGDLISQTLSLRKFNFDKETLAYENSILSRKDFNSFNLISFLKRLYTKITNRRMVRKQLLADTIIRKRLLERLDYFCHWNELDLDVVKVNYGGSPEFKFFFYEGGLDKIELVQDVKKDLGLKIWLGNSDTSTNNHLDAIEYLKRFKDFDIEIICPLSYGFVEYGDMIDHTGSDIFGSKWIGLRKFMSLEEYTKLQISTDVVIMNHNRTQAGFNIFSFLIMGKKIYLKPQSTIYKFLLNNGVVLFDVNELSTISFAEFSKPLSLEQKISNNRIVSSIFSEFRKMNSYIELLNK